MKLILVSGRKSKFGIGDEVFFCPKNSSVQVFGKVSSIDFNYFRDTFLYRLIYEFDGNESFGQIEEAALFHANPLLRLADET